MKKGRLSVTKSIKNYVGYYNNYRPLCCFQATLEKQKRQLIFYEQTSCLLGSGRFELPS